MPLEKSGDALSPRRASSGPLRLIFPPALNWVLLAYAALAIAIGWAYVASRIHTDYVQTMEAERNSLRGVCATLRSATLAMLNDGVGEAVASANELQPVGGIDRASSAQLSSTLQKQLVGGAYVRFLFLADDGRFALASRKTTSDSRTPPRLVDHKPYRFEQFVGGKTHGRSGAARRIGDSDRAASGVR